MKLKEVMFLRDAIAHSDPGARCYVEENYSGRGMMGQSTYALVFDGRLGGVLTCVVQYLKDCPEKLAGAPDFDGCQWRQDSIGRDSIVLY